MPLFHTTNHNMVVFCDIDSAYGPNLIFGSGLRYILNRLWYSNWLDAGAGFLKQFWPHFGSPISFVIHLSYPGFAEPSSREVDNGTGQFQA